MYPGRRSRRPHQRMPVRRRRRPAVLRGSLRRAVQDPRLKVSPSGTIRPTRIIAFVNSCGRLRNILTREGAALAPDSRGVLYRTTGLLQDCRDEMRLDRIRRRDVLLSLRTVGHGDAAAYSATLRESAI